MVAPAGPAPSRPGAPGQRVWFAHAVRGPACLLVVFAHLFDLFPNMPATVAPLGHFPPVTGLPAVPWRAVTTFFAGHGITPGPLGVLLFFLVSGFVIPFSLQRGTPRGFAVRRFFRLYPTLWTCLAVTLAVLAVQAHALHAPAPFGVRATAGNALLVSAYTRLPWIEPVLWSLAIEEVFYALAATAAWARLLSSRAAVVGAAAVLAGVCVTTRHAPVAGPVFWLAFNLTFVIFILIGVALHHVHQGTWRPAEGAAVGVAVFGLYAFAVHNGVTAGVASQYVPSAVVALAVFCGLFLARHRLPYSAWLDRLSSISYPLYLLHGVNGYVVTRAVFLWTGNYYLAVATAVAAALVVATVVHVLVETPTNDLGRRLSRRVDRPRHAPAPTGASPVDAPAGLPA